MMLVLGFPVVLIVFLRTRSKIENWFNNINKRQRNIVRIFSVILPALLPILFYLEYVRK